nr:MAG: AP2 domain protein [Bacteriophage sp.]
MQNQYNAKKPKNNTSGVKGVYWQKQVKKWHAYCDVNGKRYHLGLFNDIERARLSVMKFREKMHKEFCNHGE